MMTKFTSFSCPLLCKSVTQSTERSILSACPSFGTINSKRHYFWELTRRGDAKYSRNIHELNRATLEWQVKQGYRLFKQECKFAWKELTTYHKCFDFPIYKDREIFKFWDLRDPETVQKFVPTFDAIWEEGYSNASITMSPSGCALFSGYLDTETLPADRSIGRVGWAAICSPHKFGPFFRRKRYDWTGFTHLCLRVRGDGRKYQINLRTPDTFDVAWFTGFSYALYTHGGPYWQDVRIPFSRFYCQNKGHLKDVQEEPRLSDIESVTISLTERVTGPFALEIDYIGLSRYDDHKERCAYEGYAIKQAATALH